MNTFLLGGSRLPLIMVMLTFMVGGMGIVLPLVEFSLPFSKLDHTLLLMVMVVAAMLLYVLLIYCQLRQRLDDYLNCEQQAEETIQHHPSSANPLHFITGQINRSRELQLNERIEQHRQERAATIGADTSYEGEPDYDNEAQDLLVYQIGLEQQGR